MDRISENQLRKVVVDLDRRTIARPEFVDRFGGNSVDVAPWAYEVQLDQTLDEFGRPIHQLRPADFDAREDRLRRVSGQQQRPNRARNAAKAEIMAVGQVEYYDLAVEILCDNVRGVDRVLPDALIERGVSPAWRFLRLNSLDAKRIPSTTRTWLSEIPFAIVPP